MGDSLVFFGSILIGGIVLVSALLLGGWAGRKLTAARIKQDEQGRL